jgi:hypothetical protein
MFRSIVDDHKRSYAGVEDRRVKRKIAMDIVNKVYNSLGGRFLVETETESDKCGVASDDSSIHPNILAKNWAVVEAEKVVLKVLHRLREKSESKDDCSLSNQNDYGYDSSSHEGLGSSYLVTGNSQHSAFKIGLCDGYIEGIEAREHPMSDSHSTLKSNCADQSDYSIAVYGLHDWIAFHRVNLKMESGKLTVATNLRRGYIEQVVKILYDLVGKMLDAGCKCGSEQGEENSTINDETFIHPKFITVANVIVRDTKTRAGHDTCGVISADFVGGDSTFIKYCDDDKTRNKYLSMNALGRLAYMMCMMDDKPSAIKESTPNARLIETTVPNALCLDDDSVKDAGDIDDEIIDMLRKNFRANTSKEMERSGLSVMVDAGIPFPLCRFVSDLMDDHRGGVIRSDNSFSSFKDVLSDLKQMVNDPEGFLHWSSPNRWKLDLGKKLYGRDDDMKAFMNAADQVADINAEFAGMKSAVVMVSGQSGSGKSQLVRAGGLYLEKRGWRFLRCKFDRVGESYAPNLLEGTPVYARLRWIEERNIGSFNAGTNITSTLSLVSILRMFEHLTRKREYLL